MCCRATTNSNIFIKPLSNTCSDASLYSLVKHFNAWVCCLLREIFDVRLALAPAVYTSVNRWVVWLPSLLIFMFVIYPEAFVCLARLPSKLNPMYHTCTSKRIPFLLICLTESYLHISTPFPPSRRLTLPTVLGSPHQPPSLVFLLMLRRRSGVRVSLPFEYSLHGLHTQVFFRLVNSIRT